MMPWTRRERLSLGQALRAAVIGGPPSGDDSAAFACVPDGPEKVPETPPEPAPAPDDHGMPAEWLRRVRADLAASHGELDESVAGYAVVMRGGLTHVTPMSLDEARREAETWRAQGFGAQVAEVRRLPC